MTGLTTIPDDADTGAGASTADRPGAGPRSTAFVATGELLRLLLRRDRVRLAVWIAGIVGLVEVSAVSVTRLYDDPVELRRYAELVRGNAALIVQSGPGYGLDDPTVGAVLMNETAIWAIIAVALLSVFTVIRHTRADEEAERTELLRAAPVGRHAPAAAALLGVALIDLLVAVTMAAGLVATGLPVAGSVAFGLTLVGAGAAFAGLTLVAAQVASSARAAAGLACLVLGLAFVLRAVGDVGDGRLSWLSPIGWAQAVRAYADERWWVLVMPVLATVGLLAGAVALTSRRDLGAGLVRQRAGRPGAGPRLSSVQGLAVRLQRGALVGWCIGVATIGFFYGVVGNEAEKLLADNPDLADFFAQQGSSVTDAFLATSLLIVGLLAAGFTISSTLRLRGEETLGRAEPLLATATSRSAWAMSHLAVAGVGTVLLIAVGGVSTGVGFAAASGDGGQVPRLLGASLVYVPAALMLAASAFALIGFAPQWSLLAWGGLTVAAVVGLLGEVLDMPQWSRDVSPFEHVPALPAVSFDVVPIVVLLALTVALTALGLAGLRRRDIPVS